MGADIDRRIAFFVVATLTNSSSSVDRIVGGGGAAAGEVFAASESALSVTLTTWVARDAFSRVDRPSFCSAGGAGVVVPDLPRREGAFAVVFVFARDGIGVLWKSSAAGGIESSFGRSKLLRSARVVGVHVATEETALRTASA